MIEKFELGYAMSNSNFLTTIALKNNFNPQLLIDSDCHWVKIIIK